MFAKLSRSTTTPPVPERRGLTWEDRVVLLCMGGVGLLGTSIPEKSMQPVYGPTEHVLHMPQLSSIGITASVVTGESAFDRLRYQFTGVAPLLRLTFEKPGNFGASLISGSIKSKTSVHSNLSSSTPKRSNLPKTVEFYANDGEGFRLQRGANLLSITPHPTENERFTSNPIDVIF